MGGDEHQIERESSSMSNQQQQSEQASSLGIAGEDGQQHKLAGLKCQEKYGGPDDEYAEKEMVFWSVRYWKILFLPCFFQTIMMSQTQTQNNF